MIFWSHRVLVIAYSLYNNWKHREDWRLVKLRKLKSQLGMILPKAIHNSWYFHPVISDQHEKCLQKSRCNWRNPPFTPVRASRQVVPEDRYSWREACRFRRRSRKCSLLFASNTFLGPGSAGPFSPKNNGFFGQLRWKKTEFFKGETTMSWKNSSWSKCFRDVAFCFSGTCLNKPWSFWNRKYWSSSITESSPSAIRSWQKEHQQPSSIAHFPSLPCHESCADWIQQSLRPRSRNRDASETCTHRSPQPRYQSVQWWCHCRILAC